MQPAGHSNSGGIFTFTVAEELPAICPHIWPFDGRFGMSPFLPRDTSAPVSSLLTPTYTVNLPCLSLHTALYSRRVGQHSIYWVFHAFSKSRASKPRCPMFTAVSTRASRFSSRNGRRAPTANGRTRSNISTKSFPMVLRTLLVK